LNVEVDLLLTQIDHVGREQGLAVLLEVCLIGIEKTVQPRKELLSTVVGVENDRNSIGRGNGTDVVSTSNSTGNRGFLFAIGNSL
jgi:hypothetical protein